MIGHFTYSKAKEAHADDKILGSLEGEHFVRNVILGNWSSLHPDGFCVSTGF